MCIKKSLVTVKNLDNLIYLNRFGNMTQIGLYKYK